MQIVEWWGTVQEFFNEVENTYPNFIYIVIEIGVGTLLLGVIGSGLLYVLLNAISEPMFNQHIPYSVAIAAYFLVLLIKAKAS
jgi:hypothetical protein